MPPPAASSSESNSPSFTFLDPSNIRCSNRCANPVRPSFLVRGSDVIPDVDRHDRHAVILVQNHRQAVGSVNIWYGTVIWLEPLLLRAGRSWPGTAPGRRATTSGDVPVNCEELSWTDMLSSLKADVLLATSLRQRRECAGRRWRRTPSHGPCPTLRDRQVALLDLTETNPTRVGVAYPSGLPARLADPGRGGV